MKKKTEIDRSEDASFAALYSDHARAIYSHIRALVPSSADADDVFQETSTTLWQKFDQYQPNTDFRAWACRIAYYKVLKLRDRTYRSPRLFSQAFLELVSEEMIVMSDTLDARTEALRRCREKLPTSDRDLLAGYYREGGTPQKVARTLNRSVDTVYRRLRAIHDALFQCIQRSMTEPSIQDVQGEPAE